MALIEWGPDDEQEPRARSLRLWDQMLEWAALGADGWGPDDLLPYYDRLKTPIHPVADADRNLFLADVVKSASTALGVPEQDRWNDGRLDERSAGAGFFEVGYTPETNLRASTSIHYLHPARAAGNGPRVLTGLRAVRVILDAQHEPVRENPKHPYPERDRDCTPRHPGDRSRRAGQRGARA